MGWGSKGGGAGWGRLVSKGSKGGEGGGDSR